MTREISSAWIPGPRITESGYIKSRFLDDKLSTAILLGFAKYVKDEDHEAVPRKIYQHITVFEEVGHGACGSAPEGTVEELLSVDMGCVGEGLACTERRGFHLCERQRTALISYHVPLPASSGLQRKTASVSQPTFIPSTDLTRTPL